MNIKVKNLVRRVAKGKLKKARFYAAFRVSQSPTIYYNERWGERNIGTCTPRFYIDFKESVGTDIIPDCYLWVFDFMKFLSFRRNIKFDDIKIYKRNSDKKIEKTGIVYFRTIDRGEYTNSD